MTLATARAQLVSFMTASGPWAACEISTCTFGVLESVSASAIVLQPGPEATIAPLDFMARSQTGAYERTWGVRGGLYIKDNGDAEDVLGRCWQAHDDLYNTFAKQSDLSGSVQSCYLRRIGFPEGSFESFGGALWAVVNFSVEVTEF